MIHTLVIIYSAVWPNPAWDAHTPGTQRVHTLTYVPHDTVQDFGKSTKASAKFSFVSVYVSTFMWDQKLSQAVIKSVCVSPGTAGSADAGGLMLTGVSTWSTHAFLFLTKQT